MLASVRVEVVEERHVNGRKLWRGPDGLWRSRASLTSSARFGTRRRSAALAEEWKPLARVNARIVQLGGKPIPPRPS
jgi:hypothetical protein